VTITASDVIAAIAVFATVAVAWIAHLDRNGDRENQRSLSREGHEHERTLAREARLQERRAGAYRDMLVMAFRIQEVVAQTMPILESVPPPPRIPLPTNEEQREMAATVAAYGSPDVVALFRAVVTQTRAFFNAVWLVNALYPDRSMPPPRNLVELHKAEEDIHHQRQVLGSAVDELERVARDELAS